MKKEGYVFDSDLEMIRTPEGDKIPTSKDAALMREFYLNKIEENYKYYINLSNSTAKQKINPQNINIKIKNDLNNNQLIEIKRWITSKLINFSAPTILLKNIFEQKRISAKGHPTIFTRSPSYKISTSNIEIENTNEKNLSFTTVQNKDDFSDEGNGTFYNNAYEIERLQISWDEIEKLEFQPLKFGKSEILDTTYDRLERPKIKKTTTDSLYPGHIIISGNFKGTRKVTTTNCGGFISNSKEIVSEEKIEIKELKFYFDDQAESNLSERLVKAFNDLITLNKKIKLETSHAHVINAAKKAQLPSKIVPASQSQTNKPGSSYATIKFISDADGILFIDGEKRGKLEKSKPLRINLKKGDYLFKAEGADEQDNIKWNYHVDETGIEKIQEIGLQEIINQRLQAEQLRKEQELIEQKKKEQELAEQKRKEAALAEQERIQRLFLVERNEVEMALGIQMIKVGNFAIGKYEVTQALWKAIMGKNPSNFIGDNLPVEKVSWNDVQDFLVKLNQRSGKRYRLPTEDEWEYASSSKGFEYAGSDNIDAVGWYGNNSGGQTHAVGQKQPNDLGIYDMSGNVWEWCSDWYSKKKGHRVLRGGSWSSDPDLSRVAYRANGTPDYRYGNIGFRLALSL